MENKAGSTVAEKNPHTDEELAQKKQDLDMKKITEMGQKLQNYCCRQKHAASMIQQDKCFGDLLKLATDQVELAEQLVDKNVLLKMRCQVFESVNKTLQSSNVIRMTLEEKLKEKAVSDEKDIDAMRDLTQIYQHFKEGYRFGYLHLAKNHRLSAPSRMWSHCERCDQAYDNNLHPPRVLPCGHTFCNQCIHTLAEERPQLKIRCPRDNERIELSALSDIEEMPVNRLVMLT